MSLIQQLGFLEFEVSDLDAWEQFMTKVLGTQLVDKAEDGTMRFRMDGHAYRFVVTPGPRDDLRTLGWQVADARKLEECVKNLEAAGIEVTRGSADACANRGVLGLIAFRDPGRLPVEIFYGPSYGKDPFKSDYVGSHFVADELGLGHLVISTRNRDESRDFYMDVLGFKLSDHIVCEIGTFQVDIAFLHTNPHKPGPRHHGARSVQLVPMSDDTRDLVSASRRCIEAAWRDGYAYVKAGVILDDLRPRDEAPRTLFDTPRPQSAALMAAMDKLNARYGRHTVFPAAAGIDRPWKLRAAHHLPRYTTRLGEVPVVKA